MAAITILSSAQRSTSGVGNALDLTVPKVIDVVLSGVHVTSRPDRVRAADFGCSLEHSDDNITFTPLYTFKPSDRMPRGAAPPAKGPQLAEGDFRFVGPCGRYVRAVYTIRPNPTGDGAIAGDLHNVVEFGIAGTST